MSRMLSVAPRVGAALGRQQQPAMMGAMGARGFKVVVCGGSGGIGQPLSLLMAMDERVTDLYVQDVTMAMVPTAGVAADLGHLNRPSKVTGCSIDPAKPPVDQMEDCLTGADLVLVPAGMPRKPGMTRDDLFAINAGIAHGIIEACAKHCPNAVLGLIVNPVNSVVPAMCEIYKAKGLDPMKIVGVTTLDIVRANKFASEISGKPVADIQIPVIGGHAGVTILPLFSQDAIASTIPADKIEALDKRTQDGGTEVVNAKAGKGSATLSMAFSGARFGKAVLAGLAGTPTTECAYVMSSVTDLPYFSSKVTFGKNGVETVHGMGELNAYEKTRLAEASAALKKEIDTGLAYAAAQK